MLPEHPCSLGRGSENNSEWKMLEIQIGMDQLIGITVNVFSWRAIGMEGLEALGFWNILALSFVP
jgi:hypothetical protein